MELVTKVKALFRRIEFDKGLSQESILSFGDIDIHLLTKDSYLKGNILELTPTEFALLIYLFKHKERAVSREELLKNVWKYNFEVDSRVTDDVLKKLRKNSKK